MKPHVCPWWLAYSFDNPLRRLFHKPERMLGPYVKPGMTVVDLGCGMGYFSIAMARLVGSGGVVISLDIQQKMLDILGRRAQRAGVGDRIRLHLCDGNDLAVHETVDFALAFWMVHETPDDRSFYEQVFSLLTDYGSLLVAEPKMHVPGPQFDKSISRAHSAGFTTSATPVVALSNAAVLTKGAFQPTT